MSTKGIPAEYVEDISTRIARGETPRKQVEIPAKQFIGQMLPHVKVFLEQGYTYKEIAEFLGHVSASDLKKAVAKDTPAPAAKKPKKAEKAPQPKSAADRVPCKGCKGRKAPQPGV